MQNSNLSSKIFPSLREDWIAFIKLVSNDLQNMITTYNNDRNKIKDYESIINSLEEIKKLNKDNVESILDNKRIFTFIDNSEEIMQSFDAIEYFKSQGDLSNPAVGDIYNRILSSPRIIETKSKYNSLTIKVTFDKERIKRLTGLIRGTKIDYILIKELINKYKLPDDKKKNILFYPVVMLSIRQDEIKNTKDNVQKVKQEKIKYYQEKFNELTKIYYDKKEQLKDLLVKCYNVRKNIDSREFDAYNSYASNPEEINEFGFSDDIKFKVYTLAFFKIKKDIENFIDGINDLIMDDNDLDDELVFFNEMINEFEKNANMLKSFDKTSETINDEIENNVFFALDAFNRLIIDEELSSKNRNGIKALIQKASSVNNSKIDGARTSHMLGVADSEKILGKNISLLITTKMLLAYIMVGKNIFIITGETNNTDRFDKIVNRVVERNSIPIKRQIALIEANDLDYIEMQNNKLKAIIGEEEEISKAM